MLLLLLYLHVLKQICFIPPSLSHPSILTLLLILFGIKRSKFISFSSSLPSRRRRGLQRKGKLGKKVADDAEGMREHMAWPSKEYGLGMGWANTCGGVRTKEFRFRATKPEID
jgi:hypothetical protein